MIGLAVVVGLCVTGASAKPATQEGPKIVGYDCTRPSGSQVYQAGGSCTVSNVKLDKLGAHGSTSTYQR